MLAWFLQNLAEELMDIITPVHPNDINKVAAIDSLQRFSTDFANFGSAYPPRVVERSKRRSGNRKARSIGRRHKYSSIYII